MLEILFDSRGGGNIGRGMLMRGGGLVEE